jgi:uncharacterized protein YecE (DUF72 family)
MSSNWKIGTIGFAYEDWRGVFYPPGLPVAERLAYYASQFDLVELDTTFYAVPPVHRVRNWERATPADFRFVLKAPRELTHTDWAEWKRGISPNQILESFLSASLELGPKLACVLLQFPPSLRFAGRAEVCALLEGIAGRVPVVAEFRHESWWNERTRELLRNHGAGWVCSDLAPLGEAGHVPDAPGLSYKPFPPCDSAGFVYLRLCGVHAQYESDSGERYDASPRIAWWLEQLRPMLTPGRSVLATCGNSFAGHGPATCRRLQTLLGLRSPLPGQMSLFDV